MNPAILGAATTLAALFGAWRIACVAGLCRAAGTFTAWLVLSTAHIAAVTLLVGVGLRDLRPEPLAITSGGATALALAVSYLPPNALRARAASRHARRRLGRFLLALIRQPALLVLIGLVLAQYAWRALLVARLPLSDHDGLMYNLTGPDTWYARDAIVHTPGNLFADVYPDGQGLFVAWSAEFARSDHAVWLVQYLFAALGLTATAAIARVLGASPVGSVFAGCAFLAMPAVFLQASTAYVDVAAGATFLAALYFVLALYDEAAEWLYARRPVIVSCALAGAATALALSIKSTNLLVPPIVLTIAAVQGARLWNRYQTALRVEGEWRLARETAPLFARVWPRRYLILVGAAGLLVLPSVVLAGYWYLRTYLSYGNPLYPIAFPSLGWPGLGTVRQVIIGGNIPAALKGLSVIHQLWLSWTADLSRHRYGYDQRMGGFGAAWLLLGVPAIGIAALLSRKRMAVAMFLGAVAVIVFASPAAWWARLTLPLGAAGFVCLAVVLGPECRLLDKIRSKTAGLTRQLVFAATAGAIAVTMWWASNPTSVEYTPTTGPQAGVAVQASVRQAWELADHKLPVADVWPNSQYDVLDFMPRGTVLAITRFGRAEGLDHPLVSDALTRALVVVPSAATVNDLTRQLRTDQADYVLLSVLGNDPALRRAAGGDPAHYQWVPLSPELPNLRLYRFGDFAAAPPCPRAPARLEITSVVRTGAREVISGIALDACGAALRDEPVDLMGGPASTGLWTGHDYQLAEGRADPNGELLYTVPNPPVPYRFFLHTDGEGQSAPSVSSIVNPAR